MPLWINRRECVHSSAAGSEARYLIPSLRDRPSTKEAAANSAMMWMSGPGRHIK